MKPEIAIRKAIEKYFEGHEPEAYNKQVKSRKFSKQYLDGIGEEFIGKDYDKEEHKNG